MEQSQSQHISIIDIKKKITPIFNVRIPPKDSYIFPVYAKKKVSLKHYWYFAYLNNQDCVWISGNELRVMRKRSDFYREYLSGKCKEITYEEFLKSASAVFKQVSSHIASCTEVWKVWGFSSFYFKALSVWLDISDERIEFYNHPILEHRTAGTDIFEVSQINSEELLQRTTECLQIMVDKFVRLVSPSKLGYRDFVTGEKQMPKISKP